MTLPSNQLGFTSFLVSLGRRFDPALQFLYKKVRDSQALGRMHRISTISSLYPAASLSLLKASGTQQLPAEESGLGSESWNDLGGEGPLSSSIPPPAKGRDTLTRPGLSKPVLLGLEMSLCSVGIPLSLYSLKIHGEGCFLSHFFVLLVLVSSLWGLFIPSLCSSEMHIGCGFQYGDLNAQFWFFQVEFFTTLPCMT